MPKFVNTYHDNDIEALIPEFWSNEALLQLEEHMVMPNLVHRDFSDTIATLGDTVNTRRPSEYTARRKSRNEDVTIQDTVVENVPVVLNQQPHVSILLRDAELSLSLSQLVEMHIVPAMRSMARLVDRSLTGQAYRFLRNAVGGTGQLTDATAKGLMLNTRRIMNQNNCPQGGRNLVWSSSGETNALSTDLFVAADSKGDEGQALQEARLGRVYGFDNYLDQNVSEVEDGLIDQESGAVNNALGYLKGATSITVDGFSAAIANNSWVKIGNQPYQVLSTTGGATPTVITISSPGLRTNIADNDTVVAYTPAAVNEAAGYAVGHVKAITVDGFTLEPQVGQMVSFGTTTYSIIEWDSVNSQIHLDRPLEAALADNDAVNLGPGGQYNFAFYRNAIAMVNRPLAAVNPALGVRSSSISYNGVNMRVTMSYEGKSEGLLITFSMLYGVALLDPNMGAVLIG